MPIVEKYIQPYYKDSEKKKIFELFDQIDHQFNRIDDLQDKIKAVKELFETLKVSDLEIAETPQERRNRAETLTNEYDDLAKELKERFKNVQSLHMEINSIRLKVYSRYTNDKTLSEILQDCFELIELSDVQNDTLNADLNNPDSLNYQFLPDLDINRYLNTDTVDDVPETSTPSPIVQFTYTIGQKVVNWYLDYFRGGFVDSDSYFKVLKAIYDKGLKVFPDGFTDQDKQSEYCIFDKEFFRVLDALNKKQADKKAVKDYELSILANYRPETRRRILPSGNKISYSMFALGYLGTEPHQMTLDDYLQGNTVNNLVTFKGLNDDGLQFVFNENAVDKDKILVSFKNLENARGGGTAPSIIFAMVLEKMNDLGFFKYRTVTDTVTISVKELIENGDYANWRSAKRALEQALKTCSELMINFSNKYTGENVNTLWFSSIGWKDKGTLILSPNKDIDWFKVGEHFAIYPIYLYKLKTHAYKLAYYIFTQARINKPTNEKGEIVFKIKLTKISSELGLPSTTEIKKDYKKLILDKIISAMKEIEDADTKHDENRLISLKLDIKKNLTAKEIIDTGYLVVTLKKSYITESYQMIRDRQIDLIEANRKKKEKAKRQVKEKSDQT